MAKSAKRIRTHFKLSVYGDMEGVKSFRCTVDKANEALKRFDECKPNEYVMFESSTPENAVYRIRKESIVSMIATEIDEIEMEKKKKQIEKQVQAEMAEQAKANVEVSEKTVEVAEKTK